MDDLQHLQQRIDRLASDRQSGASQIVEAAIGILREALMSRGSVPTVAAALVLAQPSMAPVWNAAIEAVASAPDPARFEQFARRVERSGAALARFAAGCFDDEPRRPVRVVTLSASRSVEIVCEALHRQRGVSVACAESRPALEGRPLAARLAELGIDVVVYSDAAIAHALAGADALLLGADAVTANAFLNKSGSLMAVAAAAQSGVPVYVAATRDKFATESVAAQITIGEGVPAEVWDAPPPGVRVRNPYFEWTPLDLVTVLMTDMGILGTGVVPDVCRSLDDPLARQALAAITAQMR